MAGIQISDDTPQSSTLLIGLWDELLLFLLCPVCIFLHRYDITICEQLFCESWSPCLRTADKKRKQTQLWCVIPINSKAKLHTPVSLRLIALPWRLWEIDQWRQSQRERWTLRCSRRARSRQQWANSEMTTRAADGCARQSKNDSRWRQDVRRRCNTATLTFRTNMLYTWRTSRWTLPIYTLSKLQLNPLGRNNWPDLWSK